MTKNQYIEAGLSGSLCTLVTIVLLGVTITIVTDDNHLSILTFLVLLVVFGALNGILTVRFYLWGNK